MDQLIEPPQLTYLFELLLGAYDPTPSGKRLAELLTEEWSVFSVDDTAVVTRLLSEILGDEDAISTCYSPRVLGGYTLLEKWHEFRAELMGRNRFFPRAIPDLDRLADLLGYLEIKARDVTRTAFRARINELTRPYLPAEMGPPPPTQSTHGRANPAGIPYLYLASDPCTAVSELKPHIGDRVCVAEFTLVDDIRLVDLRSPRVSPFAMTDEDEIVELRHGLPFLAQLGEELSRPIGPRVASVEYLPSQYLCEFIKSRGFDGVVYRSSVGPGVNIALYDSKRATVGSVVEHRVVRANVDIERV